MRLVVTVELAGAEVPHSYVLVLACSSNMHDFRTSTNAERTVHVRGQVRYIVQRLTRTTVPSLSNGPYFKASNICMQPLTN